VVVEEELVAGAKSQQGAEKLPIALEIRDERSRRVDCRVCGGTGRGRGRRGCTVRDIGGTEGVGDQGRRARSICGTSAAVSVICRNSANPLNPPTMLTSEKADIVWMTQPVQQVAGRHAAQKMMHIKPDPTRFAMRNVDSPKSAFETCF
jgi:hypothetical protein